MVKKAIVAPEFIWVVEKYSCHHLPLLFVDRDECPTKQTSREYQPMELASKCEKHGCFLKHTKPKGMAHIYPNYLIHPRAEHAQKPFEFWDLLKILRS